MAKASHLNQLEVESARPDSPFSQAGARCLISVSFRILKLSGSIRRRADRGNVVLTQCHYFSHSLRGLFLNLSRVTSISIELTGVTSLVVEKGINKTRNIKIAFPSSSQRFFNFSQLLLLYDSWSILLSCFLFSKTSSYKPFRLLTSSKFQISRCNSLPRRF